jgi:hypothetical protein
VKTAAAVLAEFRARGLRLDAVAHRLFIRPRSRVTDADRMVLRAHRATLLALLEDEGRPLRPAPRVEVGRQVNGARIACGGCGRLLPASRATGTDVTCVCCRLDAIELRWGDHR